MIDASGLDELFKLFAPRERIRHLTWSRLHVRNTDGRPYSHDFYPHLGNPGGPFDALDDYHVRRLWLQFGSRLGKTFGGQCATLKKADNNPGQMMFASAVEKIAMEVVERTYKMCDASPRMQGQLRSASRRRGRCIDFRACQCFVAWSRSPSTLADKEISFGHANEVDKWEHSTTSKEADPLKLFLDRFKNQPNHKAIIEGTPTIKGKSRIERGLLSSTNCRYYVPCTKCRRYQKLNLPQLKWDKQSNGRSDKELTRSTSYYECVYCQCKLTDNDRVIMMRRGVWIPEGCGCDDAAAWEIAHTWHEREFGCWRGWSHAEWITGKPLRNSPDAGYQLSSMYAIALTFGDYAAEYVASHGRPQDFRNFINQWEGETWELIKKQTTWEKLAARIASEVPSCVCPEWASMITMGIDRQEDRFPWCIDAWGPDGQTSTIAYGNAQSFEELSKIMGTSYRHADGSESLQVSFALFDSGYLPLGVYEFCREQAAAGKNALPSKGSNRSLDADFKVNRLGDNTAMPGSFIVHVDTMRTQLWIQSQLDGDSNYAIYAARPEEHQDFLEQLLNDSPVEDFDTHGNVVQRWERVNRNIPNDFRDCRRYAFVAMLLKTRCGKVPPRSRAKQTQEIEAESYESRVRQQQIRRR